MFKKQSLNMKLATEYIHNLIKNNKSVCIVLLLGFILRFFELGSKPLWGDEIITLTFVNQDFKTYILSTVPVDIHPPLFITIVHLFTYIGKTNFILRMLPAFFGLLTVLMTYILISRFFGNKQGLIAAFLISISPYSIFYSQELRPYTFLTLLSLISLYFFNEICIGNKKLMWYGYIISCVFLLYTHYFSIFFILIQSIYYIFINLKEPNKIKLFVLRFSLVILFLLPIIYLVLSKGVINQEIPAMAGNEIFPFNESLSKGFIYSTWQPPDVLDYYGTIIPAIFFKMSIGQSHTVLIPIVFLKLTLILFIPLFVYGLYKANSINKFGTALLSFYMSLTILIPFIISLAFSKPLISTQQYLFLQPIYFSFLSCALISIEKTKRIILILFIFLIYIYSLYEYWFVIDDSNWAWMLQI